MMQTRSKSKETKQPLTEIYTQNTQIKNHHSKSTSKINHKLPIKVPDPPKKKNFCC